MFDPRDIGQHRPRTGRDQQDARSANLARRQAHFVGAGQDRALVQDLDIIIAQRLLV